MNDIIEDGKTVELFSRSAVDRAIIKNALQHAGTLYPGACAVVGGAALALFGIEAWMVIATASATAASIAVLAANLTVRRTVLGAAYITSLQRQFEAVRKEREADLRDELMACLASEHLADYGRQGVTQFDQIHERLSEFRKLVGRKFTASELASARFLASAEQVCMAVIDNLSTIVSLIGSVDTLRPDYCRERLAALDALAQREKEDEEEQVALSERLELVEAQRREANVLLTRNEQALTSLDRTTAAIIGGGKKNAVTDSDLERAQGELESLAHAVCA